MKNCSKCNAILTDENWWKSWQKQKTNICIPCGRALNKKYDTKEKAKNRRLKIDFNITFDDYQKILADQNFECSLCKTSEPLGKGSFHVDHCHSTNKIRGLLCYHCNVGLGHFKDDVDLMQKAIEYLNKHKEHYEEIK